LALATQFLFHQVALHEASVIDTHYFLVFFSVLADIDYNMTSTREQKSIQRSRDAEKKMNVGIGRSSALFGVPATCSTLQVSRGKARYWKKRVLNPLWKSGGHGGCRRQFPKEVEEAVCRTLKELVQLFPALNVPALRLNIFDRTGILVSMSYIKDVIAAADWTYVKNNISLLPQSLVLTSLAL
jgi:hypothetical protein